LIFEACRKGAFTTVNFRRSLRHQVFAGAFFQLTENKTPKKWNAMSHFRSPQDLRYGWLSKFMKFAAIGWGV